MAQFNKEASAGARSEAHRGGNARAGRRFPLTAGAAAGRSFRDYSRDYSMIDCCTRVRSRGALRARIAPGAAAMSTVTSSSFGSTEKEVP
jgi:hypothetical protein